MADGSAIVSRTVSARPILIADLFCGAGGSSTGAVRALRELGKNPVVVAVNHWRIAIETHTKNHPTARHHCTDLEHAKPLDLVPEGRLDLLIASPTCTYHSRARGGKPVNDQQRMDPWHVVRWCTDLRVSRLMIENVPEFVDWGPCSLVTGRPIKSRKGEYFQAWCAALRSIGFRLNHDVLCCADFGDPTTRKRFFAIGCSDRGKLRWPDRTHSKTGGTDLLGSLAKWRAAAEIIDWSIEGKSLFTRKRQLKPNTLRRILAGAIRYSWPVVYQDALRALLNGTTPRLEVAAEEAAPFLIHFRGTSAEQIRRTALDPASPLPAITAGGGHIGVIMATGSGGAARDIGQPIPTVTTGGDGGARPHLIQPLLMGVGNSNAAKPVTEPAPTITTGGGSSIKRPGNARPQLIEPLIAPYYGSGSGHTSKPASAPLDAITTKARFGVAEPFIVPITHSGDVRTHSIDEPLRTVTCANRGELGIAEPFLVPSFGERQGQEPRTHDIDAPLPTVAATGHIQLAEPTIEGFRIDILYRMLHWRELARAMSFDDDGVEYQFVGNATEITKQIGNAVPGRTSKALVRALMEGVQ